MRKEKKNRVEKEAIQAVKNQHSNYKWIKYMFCHLDEIDARLDAIEKFLGLRKVNKEANKQSSNEMNTP